MNIGTRAQVWHNTAKKTSGGLTKSDLMMNKHGRIVSRKKHNSAKKDNRLVKAGYITRKGHFGFVKKNSRKHSSKKRSTRSKSSRRMKKGGGTGSLNYSSYNGKNVGTSGAALQIAATNAA
jgi:hypothetical protein